VVHLKPVEEDPDAALTLAVLMARGLEEKALDRGFQAARRSVTDTVTREGRFVTMTVRVKVPDANREAT
jgi:hypothetical protein